MFEKIMEYIGVAGEAWDNSPRFARFLIVAGGAWALGRLNFPWLF